MNIREEANRIFVINKFNNYLKLLKYEITKLLASIGIGDFDEYDNLSFADALEINDIEYINYLKNKFIKYYNSLDFDLSVEEDRKYIEHIYEALAELQSLANTPFYGENSILDMVEPEYGIEVKFNGVYGLLEELASLFDNYFGEISTLVTYIYLDPKIVKEDFNELTYGDMLNSKDNRLYFFFENDNNNNEEISIEAEKNKQMQLDKLTKTFNSDIAYKFFKYLNDATKYDWLDYNPKTGRYIVYDKTKGIVSYSLERFQDEIIKIPKKDNYKWSVFVGIFEETNGKIYERKSLASARGSVTSDNKYLKDIDELISKNR